MTLKFIGWPRKISGHLFYITSSFVYPLKPLGVFKLELISRNAQFGSNSAFFCPLSRVTFKFDGWPWKTKGHLFFVASSFVHHSIAIGEFNLKLQVGNPQFGSKSAIYCPVWSWYLYIFLSCVTLKFYTWTWKTIGHLFYATSSFVHHFVAIQTGVTVRKRPFWVKSTIFNPCDLAIWRMTLKNNRAS